MNVGLFCFYENYQGDFQQALANQTKLVKHAECLGFNEVWIAEHHFNPFSVCPSILMLAAHLASVTETIRIGTAAVLLPFHDPVKIAEDLATLDILSHGRLNVGVAKGGPFPLQNKHFRVNEEKSSEMMRESLDIIAKLLYSDHVSWDSEHFKLDDVTIYPKPSQEPIPFFLASAGEESIRYAAERGYGLMGAQLWPVMQLKATMQQYQAANSTATSRLTLLRPFYVAPTRDAAFSVALPSLQRFIEKMQGEVKRNPQVNGKNHLPNIESMLNSAIIGSVEECREKIRMLRDELPLQSLVLRPVADTLSANLQSLQLFVDEVRPYV